MAANVHWLRQHLRLDLMSDGPAWIWEDDIKDKNREKEKRE